MKRTTYAAAGIILALACALAFTGCPQEAAGDPEFNSNLEGPWTNGGTSYLEKKFTIESDGSFDAYLNPTALTVYNGALAQGQDAAAAAAQGVTTLAENLSIDIDWHVTGKLIRVEGDVYKMDSLKAEATDTLITDPAKTPPSTLNASVALAGIIQNVRITLEDDGTFTFVNAGTDNLADPINQFFGGIYYKAD